MPAPRLYEARKPPAAAPGSGDARGVGAMMVPLAALLGEPVDLDIAVSKVEVRVDDVAVELRKEARVEVVNEDTNVLEGGYPVMVT